MNLPPKKPACFLFDYGETLATEAGFKPERGFAALLEHAQSPAPGLSPALLHSSFAGCYGRLRSAVHAAGAEIPFLPRLKWLMETHGLKFALPPEEMEYLFWNAAAPCAPAPGMAKLLDLLEENRIPAGVISNMEFSGANLRRRLEELYPRFRFEAVIASSDYLLRKPDPNLFQLALKRMRCAAGDAWFAGNDPAADIAGALNAGITALHYCPDSSRESPPGAVRISCWRELHSFFRT